MAIFKVVTIALLVPHGDESYNDLLSDFRDDNPDMLVEWTQLGESRRLETTHEARRAWLDKTPEPVDLSRYEQPHDNE